MAARNVPLGEKRRPGRPALAVLALLHQPRESILAEEAEVDEFNHEVGVQNHEEVQQLDVQTLPISSIQIDAADPSLWYLIFKPTHFALCG